MTISFNSLPAASAAAFSYQKNNDGFFQSISKLSSGSKIPYAANDAGGLAVSLKLTAEEDRTYAVQSNVANANSFLQTQDGALQVAGDVLNRLSELTTLSSDPTKSASDKTNYQTEFAELQKELGSLQSQTFNGVALFGSSGSGSSLNVTTNADGTQSAAIAQPNLADPSQALAKVLDPNSSLTTGNISVKDISKAIDQVANLRAQNGATASRFQAVDATLSSNIINLQSANSRIKDVDVATESTRLATARLLTQGSAALLAQANIGGFVALKLLS